MERQKRMTSSIEILVATYNGERYLAQFLDSLLAQSLPAKILIRDDLSNDQTQVIIDTYICANPDRIRQLPHDGGSKGASSNFSRLLSAATADYVLLADQDDVWDSDKIATTLAEMHRVEKLAGKTTPVLVHTDLRVVDQDLNLLSSSFFKFQGLDRKRLGLRDLLGQNVVTGCTAMLNRALYRLASPIPKDAVMHDWWIALIAAGFGRIGIVERTTLSYRQHDHNTLGAQSDGLAMIQRYLLRVLSRNGCAEIVSPLSKQAEALLRAHGGHLKPMDRIAVEATAQLREQAPIRRVWSMTQNGVKKHGRLKQGVFLWTLLNADFQKL